MVICRLILTTLLLTLLSHSSWAASLQARVDRNVITENETLRLTLSLRDYDGDINPDLSALESYFDLLGTSQSSRVSIVNGKMDSTKELVITLAPKQTGNLVIPSLSIDTLQSQPISVKVVSAGQAQQTGQSKLFLEATVDNTTPYVQQQVVLTLKLHHAVGLQEGMLPEPEIPGVEIHKLGDDTSYETLINGQRFGVVERRYALLPQNSGKFTIPSILFRGQALDNSRRQQFGMFNSPFIQNTRQVQARSKTIELDVKPQPQKGTGITWLPAQKLTLREQWSPNPPIFKVGEPVTRTLTINADGLSAAQLPELTINTPETLKLYPDQPQLETQGDSNGLHATRTEKYAIVPSQPGKLTLPALRVSWWNTQSKKMEVAQLPAKTIDILPAQINAVAPQQPLQPVVTTTPEAGNFTTLAPVAPSQPLWPWQLAVALLTLAWLTTLYLLWKKPTGTTAASQQNHSTRKQLNAVKQACQNNDPQQAKQALLNWANAQWPNAHTNSLGNIANRINNQTLRLQLNALDSTLYASHAQAWNGNALWEAINNNLDKIKEKNRETSKQGLPSLYPA